MKPRGLNWPISAVFSLFVSFIGPGYDSVAVRMCIADEARELLDVGGGSGMLALSLASLCPNLARIVSSDIAPAMVKRAVNNAQSAGPVNRIEGSVQDVGTDRILLMQTLFGGTVYSGTPSLAEYLIEKCGKQVRDPKDLGLRKLKGRGEPCAGVPEVRSRLEKAYGARIFHAGAGFGLTADDIACYMLVDPDIKESIPLEDGAEGEALFTILQGDGMAWLRTSLGDIQQVFTSPCPCVRTGFRYKVVGRTDDMLEVKGAIFYSSMVDGLLSSFVPRVTGEFRIVLNEKPPRVVPPLRVKIERAEDFLEDKLPDLEAEMKEAYHTKAKFKPEIIWAEVGLGRSTYKGQTIEKPYEEKGERDSF